MDPLLEQFLLESRENLSFLDKNLANLSSGNKEEINALFRAAHTLKGGAGLVGLDSIKSIVHYAEDLLDGIKKEQIQYTEEMLDTLYDAFDEVVEMVDATEELGEAPQFDEERIEEISNSIKAFLKIEDDENSSNSLDTELNISLDRVFGNLISNQNFSSYINQLPLEIESIDNSFLEDENFYLVDFDLDEDTCEFGNDPVYLAYLLGEDSIYSIKTVVLKDEAIENPTLWKTRILMVVKSNKESLEDCFYNILEEITIYPISIKNIFTNDYKSFSNEMYDDFVKDFIKIVKKSDYSKLLEKISAITKIVNLESKEGFVLRRLELVLPNLSFEGKEYLKAINYALDILEINIDKKDESTSTELSISEDEKQSIINVLTQQLKVLKFASDEMALSRVKLHVKNVLDFAQIQSDFSLDDNIDSLAAKIIVHIKKLNPNQEVSFEISTKVESLQIEEHEEIEYYEEPQTTEEEKEIVEEIQKIQYIQEVLVDEEVVEENVKQVEIVPERKEIKDTPKVQVAIPKTIKVEQKDIDSIMDIIGELLVMKNALPYVAEKITTDDANKVKSELMGKYEEINRVTEQLQDIVMGMRLLPLSYIFSRYPKLVRETSKKLNKKISFEEYGGDTKLDKMMIEKIADPLVHVIRNSLDHGIETSESERIEAGKNPVGMIKIGASSEGDKVKIIIEDDGRGINTPKVLAKAMQLGIVTEEQVNNMSEQEKLQMIFNPGLSTAEKITDISGRGVGTDAVKKIIEELNGNIHLESQMGKGTRVNIELPVSVALTNVFCVKMANNNYGISMDNVIETIKLNKNDMQMAMNKPYARLRGELIPLVFEERLLKDSLETEVYSIVIVQSSNLRYGLVVNEFVNQLDVVQKPLEGALANHPMITGTSLLGNGEILFILDVNGLIA